MLLFKQGNVLLADEPNHVLVHGCNALGVMGAGIAKQIRLIYVEAFEAYEKLYQDKGLRLGHIQTITYKNNEYNPN